MVRFDRRSLQDIKFRLKMIFRILSTIFTYYIILIRGMSTRRLLIPLLHCIVRDDGREYALFRDISRARPSRRKRSCVKLTIFYGRRRDLYAHTFYFFDYNYVSLIEPQLWHIAADFFI